METIEKQEIDDLVLNNFRLVHYVVKYYWHCPYGNPLYDEYIAIGNLGLTKAALTFDKTKKITFSTYASRCIYNELAMYGRQLNRYNSHNVSLSSDVLATDAEGGELHIEDVVEDPKSSSYFTEIEDRETIAELFSIIFNYISKQDRIIFLYHLADFKQRDIADFMNLSQSYISRIVNRCIFKVREMYDRKNFLSKKLFNFEAFNDVYQISFLKRDIRHFDKVFESALSYLDYSSLNETAEKVTIEVSLEKNPIYALGHFFSELENY